jgi:rhamnogalacturonyl hydrolase YesR
MAYRLLVILLLVAGLAGMVLAQDGDALLAQAKTHWEAGRYAEAAESYRQLRDECPEYGFVRSGGAQFWLWACLGNAGKKEDEVREIEAFLQGYPQHPSCGYALYFLGEAYAELGQSDKAEEAWQRLLTLYPEDAMAAQAKAALAGDVPTAPRRDPSTDLGVDFLDYALGAAEWLKANAASDGGGLAWPEYGGQTAHPVSFYSGAAGVCLYFLNLYQVTGEAQYADTARQAAAFVSSRAVRDGEGLTWQDEGETDDGTVYQSTSPGLYSGTAGIGYVFLCLYRSLGDAAYLAEARGAADGLVASATDGHWDESTDIIGGAAGIALFLLEIHRETGDQRYLDCARGAASWLLTQGEEDGDGTKWRCAASLPRYYTGFSHGTAGVAYALAEVYKATGDAKLLEAAERGATGLVAEAQEDSGGLKWYHYAPDHLDSFWNGWCHGPAGTGRLFLKLHELTAKPGYLETAKRGAEWIMATVDPRSEDSHYWGLSMCCGATGVADYALDLYLATGDAAYLEYAGQVARRLMREAKSENGGFAWTNYDEPDENGKIYCGTGHMIGAAGTGTLFLKLHALLNGREDRVIPFADKPAAAAAQSSASPYVVLTDLPDGDPYLAAARELAQYRSGEIVHFDRDRLLALRRALALRQPRYVALVLRPEEIDANLAREMIAFSTRMDSDPFPDFAFGFITGPTAEDALGLVERAIEVERAGLPKRLVTTSVVSGGACSVQEGAEGSLAARLGYTGERIYWASREEDPAVLDFVKANLRRLEGSGIVGMYGCGDPEGIWLFSDRRNLDDSKHWDFDPARVGEDPNGEMPRVTAEMLRGIDLGGAVVWSGTCHSGVLRNAFVEGDIVSTFGRVSSVTPYEVPPERSLALAILGDKPSAYIAPIGPNHGYACLPEMYRALSTGMALGDVMRTRYAEIILAGRGKLDGQLYIPGGPELSEDPMRGGGLNRILYGDPAYRPFPASGSDYLRTGLGLLEGGLLVRCEVLDEDSGMFWDMFGDDRGNPERVYTTVELPEDAAPVRGVRAKAMASDGSAVPVSGCLWAVERIDGKQLLHLQTNGPTGSLWHRGVVVEFAVDQSGARS